MNHKFFLIVFLAVIVLSGCYASFPGKELPRYSYEDIHKSGDALIAIDYDANFPNPYGDYYSAIGTMIFQGHIKRVFAESGIFERFANANGRERLHLSLKMTVVSKQSILSVVCDTISLLSLTLVPSYHRTIYRLFVDVSMDGAHIKHYEYEHYIDHWVHISMIFFPSRTHPQSVYHEGAAVSEVFDDLLKNFLYDFRKVVDGGVYGG